MKMKPILFVLILVALSSCSNSDNNLNLSESDIAGVWNLTDVLQQGTSSTNFMGEESNSEITSTGSNFNFTYDFETNPNVVTANGTYTSMNTITANGETQTTEDLATANESNIGSWVVSGNIISLTGNTQSDQMIVREYSATRMVVSLDYFLEISGPNDTTVSEGTVTLTLER